MIDLDTPFLFVEREITVLRELIGAEHVSQYYGTFETNKKLIVLTKYLEGADLKSVIEQNSVSCKETKTILCGIGKGLR